MIPTTVENETIKTDFTFVEEREQPTKTYKMLLDVSRVRGYTDKQEAIKQAIFKILQTERYQYKNVYSDNYGVEFWDLYGQSPAYCVPEIERRITEALTWDERIESVSSFEFKIKKSVISVNFIAYTIFGEIAIEGVEVGF